MASIHVIAVGAFGRAVANRIGELADGVVITRSTGTALPLSIPRARVRVLAAWRRVPTLERELDALAFGNGRGLALGPDQQGSAFRGLALGPDQQGGAWTPWLPVVLEHPVLRVGPAVVPGAGPCHGCFQRRAAQHAADRAVAGALERRYDTDPAAGPAGYLPPAALLGAALAVEAAARLAVLPVAEAGRLRRIDLLTQQLSAGRAVGVHGCVHCGLHRDGATRSYAGLRAELPKVLSWAA
jgi:bacteriocin biosynthesis cyclodehydratase domain-containing protein